MLPPDEPTQEEFEQAELDGFAQAEEQVAEQADQRAESTAQRTWLAAVALLASATVLTVVIVAGSVIPAVAGGIGDVGSGIAGVVGDSASGLADSWTGWTGRLADLVEEQASGGVTLPVPAGSDSALLVLTNAEDRGVGFALAARAPDGSAALVLLPPGLLSIMPGFGDFALSESTVFEGPELSALTVINLVGIRVDDIVHLGPGDISSALAGDVTVDLPVPLIVAEGDGDTGRVAAASGKAARSASVVETILVTKGLSEDPEWLQRQGRHGMAFSMP